MNNQNQPQLQTVTFNNTDLATFMHNNEPYVAMRPIVEGMGLDWARQTTKLKEPKFSC